MTQYDNTNRAALFVNDSKTTQNHPDFKGSADEIVCQHCGQKTAFWLSAWKKVSKGGKHFLSLAFTSKEESPSTQKSSGDDPFAMGGTSPQGSAGSAPVPSSDYDDDIPF